VATEDRNHSKWLEQPDSFIQLIHQRYGQLFAIAYAIVRDRETADDVVQEALLRAWLRLSSLREPELLTSWLSQIIRNQARQWLRAGQTRSRLLPVISLEEIEVDPPDHSSRDARSAASLYECNQQLTEAVLSLPDDMREAVLLHFAEGLSLSAIAKLSDEAPSTIARRLDRAQERLRGLMDPGAVRPLAHMKAASHSATRAIALITAAGTLSAAARAHLVQQTIDTLPYPSPPLETPATTSPPTESAMPHLTTISGFTKAAVTIATVAMIIGTVSYPIKESASSITDEATRSSARSDTTIVAAVDKPATALKASSGSALQSHRKAESRKTQAASDARPRLSPAERTAALRSDLVSTQPLISAATPQSSGTLEFNLQVVDQSGLPVSGATAVIPSLQMDMGTSFIVRVGLPPEEQTSFTTNNQGIARARITASYGTAAVKGFTVQATHPDFVQTEANMLLTNVTKLVLERGYLTDILPVNAETSHVLTADVVPQFPLAEGIRWTTASDGRLLVRNIPKEDVIFTLKAKDAAGQFLESDQQTVSVSRHAAEPVKVALYPALTIHGSVSANVPRPLKNMTINYVYRRDSESRMVWQTRLQRLRPVPVAEDGTFIISGIPRNAEVAFWARNQDFYTVLQANGSGPGFAPSVKITDSDCHLELQMAPCASVRATVVDKEGAPAQNVQVDYGPYINCFEMQLAWGANIRATSDQRGVAELKGLPVYTTRGTYLQLGYNGQASTKEEADNDPIVLASGQMVETTVTAPKPQPLSTKVFKQLTVPAEGSITYEFPAGTDLNALGL